MKTRLSWILAGLATLMLPVALAVSAYAHTVEGSFTRTLKVTGPVELTVTTGSGNIDVRPGDAASVQVRGLIRVHDNWQLSTEQAERKVRALESNPPIEQSGNIIRIGHITDPELRRHVSISYELVVPVETRVTSDTGSGDQSIAGVRGPVRAQTGSGNVKVSRVGDVVRAETGSGDIVLDSIKAAVHAETGSGNIQANGIDGGFTGSTGSGDVRLAQTASGPVNVETGSGNVEASGVQGLLHAHTGSGNITVDGKPLGDWKLDTGSGNLTLRLPAQAAFNLYAHTGSGDISTNREITVQGKIGRHELRGKVGGGGPLVDVGTGSGDIHID
ncbi:MAG: DUF4097 family beta strand repeat-containing protein [Terriglobia bacterium]